MTGTDETQRMTPPPPPDSAAPASRAKSARSWLESLHSGLPIVPPFGRGTSYTVEIGAEIKRGNDWHIIGVDIHRKDVDDVESRSVVGTLTPQQARSLARALEAGADEAELRSHLPEAESDQ